jgi:dienelactone hydrolase
MKKLFLLLFICIHQVLSAQTINRCKFETEQIINLFKEKQFDKITNKVASMYSAYYSPITLEKDWAELIGTYGEYKSHRLVNLSTNAAGYFSSSTEIQFAYLPFVLSLSFDSSWQVMSIAFSQSHKIHVAPAYVNVEAFTEQTFKVKNEEYELSANLCLPNSEGKHPLVIIIGESGPTDRDGSYDINLPYKDIAWGLSSKGFASFRMDKRAVAHGIQMLFKRNNYESFTCREDYLDDLYKAIDTLVQMPSIDANSIYIIGHGQGGMLIPLICKEKPFVKGGVFLGVNQKRVQEMMIDQYQYLIKVTPAKKAEFDLQIRRAKYSMSKKLNPLTEHKYMPFEVQATYWVWLNNYQHVKMAKKMKQPLFILQGERDYQVSTENYLLWQNSLKKKKNAQFLLYPKLNHLFEEGEGESTYSEYFTKKNIPNYVVYDIYNWLMTIEKQTTK